MADNVTAQNVDKPFPIHDEGQFAAVCVDIVDLGEKVDQYQGKPPKLAHKAALVFRTNSPGEVSEIHAEMTVSMGEKSNMRKFLEAWRGKSYSAEQAAAGVPLNKLVGHPGLVSVEHKKSAKDRTYAKMQSIAPLPAGLAAPQANGYKRAEFWQGRKEAYASDAAKYKQTVARTEDPVEPIEEDDDLPF